MPLFCRHNRFEANCPICAREKAPARTTRSAPAGPRRTASGAPAARRPSTGAPRAGRMVTRRLARAADDGYRNDLVPGIRATSDAERLAACLAVAAARLEFPGPYPAVAEVADGERAAWLAFLLALAGPDRPELQEALLEARPDPADGASATGLGEEADRAIAAYRAFAERHGGQIAALTGDGSWTPQRRFARAFDRLALPGFSRGQRFELLVTLGASGHLDVEADSLHVAVAHDDATTLAAKRALNSGDAMLLERRARALAEAACVPLGALDRALAMWDRSTPVDVTGGDGLQLARAALALD